MNYVSFSGTRQGLSPYQLANLKKLLLSGRNFDAASHGNCRGGDVQFHKMLRDLYGYMFYIAVFPSTASTGAPLPKDAQYVADRKAPLERDKDIVNFGRHQLIAAPLGPEIRHSGTWSTIRYAIKRKVPVEILWRSKELEERMKCLEKEASKWH